MSHWYVADPDIVRDVPIGEVTLEIASLYARAVDIWTFIPADASMIPLQEEQLEGIQDWLS